VPSLSLRKFAAVLEPTYHQSGSIRRLTKLTRLRHTRSSNSSTGLHERGRSFLRPKVVRGGGCMLAACRTTVATKTNERILVINVSMGRLAKFALPLHKVQSLLCDAKATHT
jgi:hypothetical protein